jgi:hypothetical protein
MGKIFEAKIPVLDLFPKSIFGKFRLAIDENHARLFITEYTGRTIYSAPQMSNVWEMELEKLVFQAELSE